MSFTTIPLRLEKGLPERCIRSLLTQEITADWIIVNVPRRSRKGIDYNVARAEALASLSPRVAVNWLDKDYGPVTKLVGGLLWLEAAGINDANILLVDDDCEYKPWMSRRLVTENVDRPRGFIGRTMIWKDNSISDSKYRWSVDSPTDVSFLETFGGVLYRQIWFSPACRFVAWLNDQPKFCSHADDILIATWLRSMNKLTPLQLACAGDDQAVHHDAQGTEQLNSINCAGNNTRVVDYYKEWFRDIREIVKHKDTRVSMLRLRAPVPVQRRQPSVKPPATTTYSSSIV